MSAKLQLGNLKKVIALCDHHGFVHQSPLTAEKKLSLSYGPLGSEFRRNLIKSWWRDVITQQEHVVGIESPFQYDVPDTIPMNETNTLTKSEGAGDIQHPEELSAGMALNDYNITTLNDLLPHYNCALDMSEKKLPIGLAQVGYCHRNGPYNHDRFIFQTNMFTYLSLSFFCAPKDASRWQNSWQRARLQWWRKFSGTPSQFTITDVKSEGSKQIVEVKYPFPWGDDVIERLTNYGSAPMEEIQKNSKTSYKVKDGRRMVLPHLIQSVSILEGGMLAYLLEAYQDAIVPGQTGKRKRQFLRLHSKLCPIKVAIVTMQADDEIQEVSDYLAKEFRSADVNVIQASTIVSSSKPFERLDKMGVPNSVLLSEDTVKSGIVKIRNRDTTLTQDMHISKVRQELQR